MERTLKSPSGDTEVPSWPLDVTLGGSLLHPSHSNPQTKASPWWGFTHVEVSLGCPQPGGFGLFLQAEAMGQSELEPQEEVEVGAVPAMDLGG